MTDGGRRRAERRARGQRRARQQGVALFTVIFLLVVIALIAGMVAMVTTTQQLSSARSLDAERAYYAALGQLDLALDEAVDDGTCPADDSRALAGFRTRVQCAAASVSEGGETYNVYSIEVSAFRGSRDAGTLVRRTVRAQITDL